MISCKDIAKEDTGNQWTLGGPLNVVPDDFWDLCKVDDLDCNSDVITGKYRCIDLDRSLWFMLVKYMWKNHSVFNEHMIYVKNDT